jgi:large subunit ribosomal protein L18
MPDKQVKKQVRLQRRKYSVRNHLSGTAERPRLSVFRSDKHIYAQLIDDISGKTLAAAASTETEVRGDRPNGGNVAVATVVGGSSPSAAPPPA